MTKWSLSLLLPLAVGCATVHKPVAERFHQAGHGLPAVTEFPEGPERAAYAAAHAHEAKGDAANGEAARGEWATAATGYAQLGERAAAAEWRVPLRHHAAELFLRAQRWEKGGEVAQALVSDPAASDASKAVGARLAATAALGAAGAAAKAGQLEKLDLSGQKKRAERAPAAAWQRVVDATDAYLARAGADPDAGKPSADVRPGLSPAELALAAAEVQYAYGHLDDAKRRFEALMDRARADAEVLEPAVPLYLATFGARGDREGYDAAVDRLRSRIDAEIARAVDAKEKAALGKVRDVLARARAGARFGAAEQLLAQGKAAEAAQAFEAVAEEPGLGEPANALHNAAVAWDKAGEAAKAAKARERILHEHADSPVAPEDALSLAAHRSRKGDHAASARLYGEYLERWPQGPSRCLALQNVASELDLAERPPEAAAGYLAFGRDEACARKDPDLAVRALLRAGELFQGQARSAYGAAAKVPGVDGLEAKRLAAEARRRLKGL